MWRVAIQRSDHEIDCPHRRWHMKAEIRSRPSELASTLAAGLEEIIPDVGEIDIRDRPVRAQGNGDNEKPPQLRRRADVASIA